MIVALSVGVAHAESDFDGIWNVAGYNAFFSTHSKGSTIVSVTYIPSAGESFVVGNISGNTVNISYASDLFEFEATVILTSDTSGILTVNKCTAYPGDVCLFPAGTTYNIVKIF